MTSRRHFLASAVAMVCAPFVPAPEEHFRICEGRFVEPMDLAMMLNQVSEWMIESGAWKDILCFHEEPFMTFTRVYEPTLS